MSPMQQEYIEITFHQLTIEQTEILIALLSDADYYGFEENEQTLKAFIYKNDFDEAIIKNICDQFSVSFSKKIVQQKNWNEEWETNFQPVVVDDFVAIRADFHRPVAGVQHEIIITPKMSFGTGHHATTFLMIQQMRELSFKGKKVLDFGTGTGILAIVAEKCGASSVTAIDNDEWSIANAKENVKNNSCKNISILQASTPVSGNTYDIILANINKLVILEYLQSLIQLLPIEGIILLSGLLQQDKEQVMNEALKNNLVPVNFKEKDNWICFSFHK
ncbi:MAG TPA: 50S ribosomal protein L11 methyltransferase [Chitinophagaceae bacterium]